MQAVFALAFLALANAAIIDPIYYNYEPEAKIYNDDAVISAPVTDAVIASGAAGVSPVAWAKSASPWASIISGAAPAVSSAIPLDAAFAPALKSGLAHAIPAMKSAAYHLVKADYPYFTAAPTSSHVEATAPISTAEEIAARHLFSNALAGAFPATAAADPVTAAALRSASAAGLVHAAAPATHFLVAAPAGAAGMPMFKSAAAGSAAFPWGLVSSFGAPSSVAPASAAAPISLVRVASPLLGAESAFAPASAVHAIHAAPAFAAAPPAGFSGLVASPAHASAIMPSSFAPIHLVRASPASFATGLFGAESALTGFAAAPAASVAPASAFGATPVALMKAISPASGLVGAETSVSPAGHAFIAALKAAFPSTAASLAGAEGLTFTRAVPTLAGADAAALAGLTAATPAGLTAFASPAGIFTLADSPALKAWMQ